MTTKIKSDKLFFIMVAAFCLTQELTASVYYAPTKLHEADYVKKINIEYFNGAAAIEVPTPDGARCDILTEVYAIEVDYAPKWAEAIGQSLYYGIALNRKPCIYLLMRKGYIDRRYYSRCLAVCAKHGILLRIYRVEP